jgi:hypothetical protein
MMGNISAGLIFVISIGWYSCASKGTAGMTTAIHATRRFLKNGFQQS